MDVRAELNYPTGTPAQVFALAVDPEFRAAVCEATAALDYDIEVEEHEDGGAYVKVDRVLPSEVPDFVRSFVGDTIAVRQKETWQPAAADGSRIATLEIGMKGQPVKLRGSITLRADGSGCRQSMAGELKVSVPFIGRKIEPEIAKAILAAARVEEETGRSWLES